MRYQFNQEPTFEQVVEAADYAASLVGVFKALELPLLLGDDLSNAILAYHEQAEGRKVHITPELRAKVDLLTEYLVEHSRQVDDEEEVVETTNTLTEILLGLGVPEDIVEQAMNLSVTVADYLTELVGDEDLALEVYGQLDPMYAPFAILAYRDQANGGETYLEPEVRRELDRLTEILAELSREQEAQESDEDNQLEFPDYDLPPEVKDRINRLAERLADALGVAEEGHDSFDHYEDYRVNAKHWPTEDEEDSDYAYGNDEEAYQLLQEDILRAARKNSGYVLATREVWAKPVVKSVDGRWIFETEYGLEYLDFEDYEFSPEFIDFEHEEALTDLD